MTADEWADVLKEIRARWPKLDWPAETKAALFNDLKHIDRVTVHAALAHDVRDGKKVYEMDPMSFAARVKACYVPEPEPAPRQGGIPLREWLQSRGYRTPWEAVREEHILEMQGVEHDEASCPLCNIREIAEADGGVERSVGELMMQALAEQVGEAT